ncbi:unnamed protein product [Mytilus coruscus]|uniref:Cell wall hydrolase SleB domain-containing protein n=1 Tax=Mytilus coruscus TaxID=42192 RepID=A0A6J8B7X9_MYTCO|nr:unnamed protein product [Mytilus coruscus]
MFKRENIDIPCQHTTTNKEKVGRVVFGEASGESAIGQLEVAYTIVNRISHAGFPNSLNGVVDQTYTSGGKTFHHYNTLDNSGHDQRWTAAKKPDAREHAAYNSAITQAGHALCATKSDPISCGPVNFCATNPCASTNSNRFGHCSPMTEYFKRSDIINDNLKHMLNPSPTCTYHLWIGLVIFQRNDQYTKHLQL